MALSARNQLPGIVESVQIGSIMAHVVVKVGDNLIESVITRTSAEELGLKKGDSVKVVVKSTEVMIQKGLTDPDWDAIRARVPRARPLDLSQHRDVRPIAAARHRRRRPALRSSR